MLQQSNRSRLMAAASISICAIAVSGCADRLAFFNPDRSYEGALPIVENNKKFFKVDLPVILDPMSVGEHYRRQALLSQKSLKEGEEDKHSDRLALAFWGFDHPDYGDEDARISRRNSVQARLVASSNQACNEFKQQLNALQSEGNLILGAITTALAGAGAIVTGAAGARALSGTAGIFSGVRAEFNENLFRKLTAEVITRAIDARRDEMRRDLSNIQGLSLRAYPVEGAVGDAIRYNDVCTLINGLQLASKAVTVADDPGIKRLAKLYEGTDVGLNLRLNLGAAGAGAQGTTVTLADGVALQISDLSPPREFDRARATIVGRAAEVAKRIAELTALAGASAFAGDLAATKILIEKAVRDAETELVTLGGAAAARLSRSEYLEALLAVEAASQGDAPVLRKALEIKRAEMDAFIENVKKIKKSFLDTETIATGKLDSIHAGILNANNG